MNELIASNAADMSYAANGMRIMAKMMKPMIRFFLRVAGACRGVPSAAEGGAICAEGAGGDWRTDVRTGCSYGMP